MTMIAYSFQAIEPLRCTDHSLINYLPFEKNFYTPHLEIASLSAGDVDTLLKKLGIYVCGVLPPKPVCSFGHFGFDEKLMSVVRKSGFVQPTPIQAQVGLYMVSVDNGDVVVLVM